MPTQSPTTPKSPKSSKPQKHPNNIRKAIQSSAWKFYQVAEKTNIPRETLVDYCAGKYPVPSDRLDALAELLQRSPEYLVPPFPNVRASYESRSRHEETKDLEALVLLRTHCQQHPTDENTLQQLMELLGKVGRYAEIEKWYEQFVQAVKKEDIWRKPDAETTALLARLRAEHTSSPPPEQVGKVTPTKEVGTEEPEREAHSSLDLSGYGEPLPISKPSPTHGQRIGETVWLTIAIPSSELQALAQASSSEHSTPATLSEPSLPASPSLQSSTPLPFQSVGPQDIILVGAGANTQKLDAKKLRDYYLASSTDIVPSLKLYCTHCQEEVTICRQQIDIYETIKQRRTMNDEQIINLSQITRRDLITLASVSSSLIVHIQRGRLTIGTIEEFLSEATASVTTCWYLLQGNDLTIIEVTLPLYLPELETLVKSSSRYRRQAAYLAAQGFLQRGLVALHHLRFAERVIYCQKAVEYASTSGDLTLLVTCLIHLSGAFRENGQFTDMLETYLRAERYSLQLPGFTRSRVQAKLSLAYAKQGKGQEVTRCLGESHRLFTEPSDEIPVFLSADHSLLDIILNEGLSILHLGNHAESQGKRENAQKYWKDAAEKFDKMKHLSAGFSMPVHIAAQILLAQASAYAKARNMEGFLTAFPKGVQLANELGSGKRRQEAREALKEAIVQWKGDTRVTGLWELL